VTGQADGYVYILSNPSMPNLVKIGKTRRGGRHRAKEIYQTGVPTPFTLEYEVYTHDCDALEYYVHECLDKFRVNQSREFFELDVIEAIKHVTHYFIRDFNCELVISDLGDLECTLQEMVNKSGVEDNGFISILDMRQALDFIDAKAISDSMDKLTANRMESALKRKLARKTNGDLS